jgi:putative FmdB family regulatory protein
MPIYEYRCGECGFQKEFLQRISDAQLTDCPQCGKPALNKLLSAAGFQLKGTGWYATDFKNNNKGKPASGKDDAKATSADTGKGADAGKSADTGKSAAASDSGSKPDAPAGGIAASSAGS